MEVILKKDIEKCGKNGSVIKVKDGFARNFLFPRKLAVPVTPVNLERIEQEKKKNEIIKQQKRTQALELSNRLKTMSITISAQTHDEDKLFGSINASNIVDALKDEGIVNIDKDAVILDEPIKTTGVYEVSVKLHPDVTAKMKIWVVKSK